MSKNLKADAMSKCIGCFTCMNICSMFNYQNHSLDKSAIRVRTSGGLSGKFIAVICRSCVDAACVEVCPSSALTLRKGGGVILSAEKCIGCKKCVESCVAQAISFDENTKKPIICRHCGLCAKFCPHDCLTMEEAE